MPPEIRAQFVANYSKALSELPDEMRSEVVQHARGPAARLAFEPADIGEEFDLEKAWHGIHFLLCGIAERCGRVGVVVVLAVVPSFF